MRPALPRLAQQAVLALMGLVTIYAALMPLGPGGDLVAPDLLFCLVVAWMVRAPETAALGLVVGLGVFADLMLSRPVGLGALGLMLASEAVRANQPRLRGGPFALEWLVAVAVFAAMLAGMHLTMRFVLADTPDLGSSLRHAVTTAFAYPVVAGVLALGLGVGAASRAGLQRISGRLP